MNSFKGQLDEEDVNDVIAFLKYLTDPSLVSDTPIGELTEEDKAGESSEEESAVDEPSAEEGSTDDN